jgi:hypothetical protein
MRLVFEVETMKQIKVVLSKLNDYAIKLNKTNKREYRMFFKPHVMANVISKQFDDSSEED